MRAVSTGSRFGVRCSPLVVLVLAQIACGGAGAGGGTQSPTASEGGDLEAQFKREAEPEKKHRVQAQGAFTATIEGKTPPKVERGDKIWSITTDLGWGGSELRCFVYDDVVDTGTAAHTMLKAAAKDVTFKALSPYFLEHQALDPIVGIRGVYQVERDGELLAGDLKLAVLSRSERPLACWHDAPGYAQSFARVTSDFAQSFQFQRSEPPPARGELWTMTLDGVPIGFSRDGVYPLEDGTFRKVTLGARFVPAGPGEMSFEDEAHILTYDKEGTLASGTYLSIENGESSLKIDIERKKTGYNYVGTIQNKEVNGSFKSKTPLKVQRALENKLKSLAGKKKKAKFEQWEYHPSLDVANATLVSYEVTPGNEGMGVVMGVGKRAATLKTNTRGVIQQFMLSVGSRQIRIDLSEEAGEP